MSARPIGWASLDEEAREGIDGKVDKAELARRRSWSLVKRLGWNAKRWTFSFRNAILMGLTEKDAQRLVKI